MLIYEAFGLRIHTHAATSHASPSAAFRRLCHSHALLAALCRAGDTAWMSLGGGGVDNAPAGKEAKEEGEEDELTFDEPSTVLSGDRSKAAGTWGAEAVVATVDQGGLSALHAAVFGG